MLSFLRACSGIVEGSWYDGDELGRGWGRMFEYIGAGLWCEAFLLSVENVIAYAVYTLQANGNIISTNF